MTGILPCHHEPDPPAVFHAASPYSLAFDDFSEPRTIPAGWDLSELLATAGEDGGGVSEMSRTAPPSDLRR
jgi:hypothetical protein